MLGYTLRRDTLLLGHHTEPVPGAAADTPAQTDVLRTGDPTGETTAHRPGWHGS